MKVEHVLIDLNVVRQHRLIEAAIEQGRERFNKDGTTSFTWLTLDDCARAGAILDARFTLTTRQALHTPDWYVAKCEAQSRAVWREQLTEAEAAFDLAFWHGVCTRLRWPEGWAPL